MAAKDRDLMCWAQPRPLRYRGNCYFCGNEMSAGALARFRKKPAGYQTSHMGCLVDMHRTPTTSFKQTTQAR